MQPAGERADLISGMATVPCQHASPFLEFVRSIDDGLYKNRLPHVLDALLSFLVLVVAMGVFVVVISRSKPSPFKQAQHVSTLVAFARPSPKPAVTLAHTM